ncbi:MAG TPA: hypothetical protein VLW50_02335 [Streptosporangiaceae bacterium]|nr:hypothetical protein [Streptosporangiaceae bacterium]
MSTSPARRCLAVSAPLSARLRASLGVFARRDGAVFAVFARRDGAVFAVFAPRDGATLPPGRGPVSRADAAGMRPNPLIPAAG